MTCVLPGAVLRNFFVIATVAGIACTVAEAQENAPSGLINLLKRYPTTLTGVDLATARARPWQFSETDIFQLSRFTLEIATHNVHLHPGAV